MANKIVANNMYYTYVLFSLKDKQLYIGFTADLENRIEEHMNGEVDSTKSRRPLKFIFAEIHLAEKDARRRECYFKTTKGKSALNQMLRESFKQLGYRGSPYHGTEKLH